MSCGFVADTVENIKFAASNFKPDIRRKTVKERRESNDKWRGEKAYKEVLPASGSGESMLGYGIIDRVCMDTACYDWQYGV